MQLLCKQQHISWLLCKHLILILHVYHVQMHYTFFLSAFVLTYLEFHRYEGSIGPASRAMAAADQLTWQLGRKNL